MKLRKHTCFAYDHQWHFVFPIHEDSSQANHKRSQNNFCAVSSFRYFNSTAQSDCTNHIFGKSPGHLLQPSTKPTLPLLEKGASFSFPRRRVSRRLWQGSESTGGEVRPIHRYPPPPPPSTTRVVPARRVVTTPHQRGHRPPAWQQGFTNRETS